MRKNFQRPIAVLAAACVLSTGFTGFSQNTSIIYAAEAEETAASTLEAGVYSVPVSLMNAGAITNASMAASCVSKSGVLTVKEDGTMSIQITLQTLSMYGLYGNASDIKVYSSYEDFSNSTTIDAIVDSTRTGLTGSQISYTETTVPERVTIALPYTDKDGVFISMFVDAMNMSTDAFLEVDFSNALNMDALSTQMNKAESLTEANFTKSSYEAVTTAYEAAITLLSSSDVTSEAIDTATANLQTAMNALVLADGTYSVPGTIYKASSDAESVMATGIEKTATVTVTDGKVVMNTTLLPVTHYWLTGYVSDVKTLYNVVLNESGTPDTYASYDAEVLTTYDVVDDYNSADSSLTEVAGVMYPKNVNLTFDSQEKYAWISMYVPAMAAMGQGTQIVRLCTDYASATVLVNDETGSEDTVVEETAISFNKTSVTVTAGKTATLKTTVTGQGASETVKYTSSKPSVATVSSKGVVTGVKAGTATITATIDGKTATCKVTVKAAPTIKLNKTAATIYTAGTKTVQLKATVTGDSKTVTYKSSKPSVATVSKTGKVTAVKAGTTTITATANGVSTTVKVTVKKAALTVSKTKVTIKKSKTVKITAKATPSATITYKSSKSSVATVTSKGVIKAKKAGTCTITVKANGITKTIKVTVK